MECALRLEPVQEPRERNRLGQVLDATDPCERPLHTQTGEPGGLWRDLGRPEAKVLGVQFKAEFGDASYAPYKVLDASHWALDYPDRPHQGIAGPGGIRAT